MFFELLLLASSIAIHAKSPLTISENQYSSILFRAESSTQSAAVPAQFSFTTSGDVPPGMVFESYPCHKPGVENCAALASADGIYLDGTPTKAGTYRVKITAKNFASETGAKEFVVTVKSSM